MLSLYEILKASKTGIAPDMWTALAGRGGADSGHEVKELTGIPPLSFTADGTPLLDYLISGNTVQNGTPTPSNPVDVNGVGVRTENLIDLDDSKTGLVNAVTGEVNTGNTNYLTTNLRVFQAGTYTISLYNPYEQTARNTSTRVCIYTNGVFDECVLNDDERDADYSASFTLAQDKQVRISVRKTDENVMLNTGSTPLPYEPYGIKIPISNGQQTTNIHLGSTQTTRQIKKLVLTGAEDNWRITGTGRMAIPLSVLPLRLTTPYCTHFIGTNAESYNNLGDGECSISVTSGSVREFGCYVSTITTLADFKTWLQQQYVNGTPVNVWYVLATPQTVTVNEPLMKIGDYADTVSMEQAGVSIPTLNGQTVVDVETTPKPSQMYIKYQQ